jgi:hypothetical protein
VKNLTLDYLHAKDGNDQEHWPYAQVVPVINAVEVWGPATWLKGSPVVTTRLTPRQARVLARATGVGAAYRGSTGRR